MKPVVDQETCIGCEACALYCPEVFRMGANNKSEVIEGADYNKNKLLIDDAIKICPVQAIFWEE